MTPLPPGGLYAITDARVTDRDLLTAQVAACLRGGARMVQYRAKRAAQASVAAALLAICREAHVPLIVNDDVELASVIGADGVHIGGDDIPLAAARTKLGPQAIIGVSCYDQYVRAEAAAAGGASYVAFGSFFPSSTKPLAVRAHPSLLGRAAAELRLPVVAIGGITPDNGRTLLDAGADWLAAIDGVFGQPDIEAAARRYAALFAT
jgi:thiamine-phosphate pyrophosphorylase